MKEGILEVRDRVAVVQNALDHAVCWREASLGLNPIESEEELEQLGRVDLLRLWTPLTSRDSDCVPACYLQGFTPASW